ncbi:hypothetical protein [Halobellus sp. EA9]|uniref:hypothetical protein n=1 Tax=Halobellus sp. EA9 TaxID=3421647 RepID=UPI003EB9CDE7
MSVVEFATTLPPRMANTLSPTAAEPSARSTAPVIPTVAVCAAAGSTATAGATVESTRTTTRQILRT